MSRSYLRGSVLSGCFWGAMALLVGYPALYPIIWGGVLASPAIGLAIGILTRPMYTLPRWTRVVLMGVALYVSATLFGVASGVWDIVRLPGRAAGEVVLQSIYAMLWGLTFSGYVIAFWPMAWTNHVLLGRCLDQPPTTGLDSTPNPSISTSIESPSFK